MREPGDAPEEPLEELPADHRGELDGALAVLAQSIKARHDDSLDRVGDAGLVESAYEPVAAVLATEHADVEQGLRDLFYIERNALGLGRESLGQLAGKVGAPEHAARHRQ